MKYRLPGLELILTRSLVDGAMTALLVVLYLLFFGIFARLFTSDGNRVQPALLVGFCLAVSLTFQPVRQRTRGRLERLVYGGRYDHVRTFRVVGEQLAAQRPLQDVLADVAGSLAGVLDARGVVLMLPSSDGRLTVWGGSGDFDEAVRAPASLNGETFCCSPGGGQWLRLSAQGESYGLLYLGPRRGDGALDGGDIGLAQTVARQTALLIAKARLEERLKAELREIALLRDKVLWVREEEQQHLAEVLHDTPLQSVQEIVAHLNTEVERLQAFPSSEQAANYLKGVRSRLGKLVRHGEQAEFVLREVCGALYPTVLGDLGLETALRDLATSTMEDEFLTVHLACEGYALDRQLPSAVEDVLFRIAREAVENACRHSEARNVWTDLKVAAGAAVLTVRDDGRGFTASATTLADLRQGRIGLAVMRQRVERLGGTCRIDSQPGEGTTVCARLAIAPGEEGQGWRNGAGLPSG